MRITGFTTAAPSQGQTKTFQEFGEFLGRKPHYLGMVANLYPELSATLITEGLMNTLTKSPKAPNAVGIDDTAIKWEVKINDVKRVKMIAAPDGTGVNKSEVKFVFNEVYYQRNDIFKVEGSNQHFIVVAAPVIKANNHVEIYAKVQDRDPSSTVNTDYAFNGALTRWIGNAQPEISEQGFTKHQSNFEVHMEHMSCVRNDTSASARYRAGESLFIKTAGENKTGIQYKMLTIEKELLDNFMYAKNSGILLNRSNHDSNGRCMIQDREGRDLPVGNGILTQIELYADKYEYAKLSLLAIQEMLSVLRNKSEKPQGNDYIMMCNNIYYDDVQRVLSSYLSANRVEGTLLYSKKANSHVDVGATYDSYLIAGNKVTFIQDKTLTLEYPDYGMAMIIDLTADKTTGRPAVETFTLKGQEFIRSTYDGIGGQDGKTSGKVSSLTTSSVISYLGYAGVAVYSPYRSYIMRQAR